MPEGLDQYRTDRCCCREKRSRRSGALARNSLQRWTRSVISARAGNGMKIDEGVGKGVRAGLAVYLPCTSGSLAPEARPFRADPGLQVYSCCVPKSRGRKPKKAAGRTHRRGDPRLASRDALAAARFEDAKNLSRSKIGFVR